MKRLSDRNIMKLPVFLFLLFLFFWPSANKNYYLIVGTYDSPKSEGIYVYTFNSINGSASEVNHIKTSNPSYLTISPDEKFIYAVHENAKDGNGGEVAAFSFDKRTGTLSFINKQFSGGDHPCYVEIDKTGQWVFSGNYSSGSVAVLPVNPDGSLGTATTVIQHNGSGKNAERQKGPHVHCTKLSADNRWLFVPDLGIDKTMIYAFDAQIGKLTPARQPFAESIPGSGPRHFTFHPNNKYAYLVEELSGTVVVFQYNNGMLKNIQRISSMPLHDSSFAGSADIHVSPDGKFLYASNRATSNTIAIFKINKANGTLTAIGHQSTLGKTPRNFSIDPSGNFLLVANQASDEIVVFKRNKQTGMLTDTGKRIHVGKPVCLKWIKKE